MLFLKGGIAPGKNKELGIRDLELGKQLNNLKKSNFLKEK
jgi:hypothetical protein